MPTDNSVPIAVAIADLHLSLLQPACRADDDWMAVQAHYLAEVKEIANGLPILCAGDIFDRWNAPPELINFALEYLPNGMLCVPGQHDLPNHQTDQMHRCGYGVLKKVGKIRDISGQTTGNMGGWIVYGFAWGQEIQRPATHMSNLKCIALIHRYCWTINYSYPGAPEDSHLNTYAKPLRGYDVAVFGDNHKGFTAQLKFAGTNVLNCGGLIRRKSDEIGYNPSIGIIYSDGTVKRRWLDTSMDNFHDVPEDKKEIPLNMREFIEGLEGLGEHGLNFREAVENFIRDEEMEPEVKEIIVKALA